MKNDDKKGYKKAEVDALVNTITKQHDSIVQAQRARIDELKAALKSATDTIDGYKSKSDQINKAIVNAVAKAEEIEKLSNLKYSQEIARLQAFHEKWISYYYRILEKYPIDEDLATAGEFSQRVRKVLARQATDIELETNVAKVSNSLEDTFESEKRRLEEKQIGYITVKTDKGQNKTQAVDEDKEMLQLVPDADLTSPIISGDPLERIRQFLSSVKTKEARGETIKKSQNKKSSAEQIITTYSNETAATIETGFSFEEALNPKDDLETIMKDLGLLLD